MSGPPFLLAALKEELAPLRRSIPEDRVRFVRTGVGLRRAAEAVEQRCREAGLIISTGCCGGLVPGASRGMLAVPDRVLLCDGEQHSDVPPPDAELAGLARRICEQLGLHCSPRPLASVHQALHAPESKRRCHEQTGAVVVDMETAAIARAAHDRGIPYVSIRVVLDTADEVLPRAPMPLRDERGKLSAAPFLDVAKRPRDLLTFAALAFRLRSGSAGLVRCVGLLLEEIGR